MFAKQNLVQMFIPSINTLGDCPVATPKQERKNKENNMSYIEENQREHLRARVYEIRDAKVVTLKRAYGLEDDEAPSTPQELVDRIKAGTFVLNNQTKDEYTNVCYATRYIRWRDPAKVEDKEGYRKAKDVLWAAFQKAIDAVTILPVVDGLTAMQAFEAQIFS